ncbi:hypothetical protein GmarT_48250 [Gimesia maris]|uniref:Uncharacterized protein n=1 Tax=Gimesia maris TaxID=122 RepID=A0ABX5YTJ3_9PLAN|nr:hypothetical protein GmarT_48250 [Gimesia maris]
MCICGLGGVYTIAGLVSKEDFQDSLRPAVPDFFLNTTLLQITQ